MSVYFVAENSREYHKIRFLSIIEAKFLPTFFETTQQIDLRKQTMIIPNYSTPNAFFVIRLYNWVILWSPMCLFVLCEGVWGSIFHTVLTKHIFSVRLIVDAKACEQLNNKLRIGWLSHLADWSRMYHWCIYYKVSVTRLSRPTCFSLTLYPIWASYSYTQYWSISHTASISQRRPHVHNKKNSAVSLTPLSQTPPCHMTQIL